MARISAVVAIKKEQIAGGAPIFVVENEEDLEKMAFQLEKILDASAHRLANDMMIIVDRNP